MGHHRGHSRVASCWAGLALLLLAAGLAVNACSLNPQPAPPAREGSGDPTTGNASSDGASTPTTPTAEGVDGGGIDTDGGGIDTDGDGLVDGVDSDGDGVVDPNVEGANPGDDPNLTGGTSGGPAPTAGNGGAAGAAGAPAADEPEGIP